MPKKRSRRQVSINSRLEQRLAAYAAAAGAAGVGLLAMAPTADARVVYTPAHQEISRDQQINLDLNADGTIDFRILVDFICYTNCQSILLLLDQHLGSGSVEWASHPWWAEPLRSGQRIGSKKRFTSSTYVKMATFRTSSLLSSSTGTAVYGPWVNVKHRYLGLKFNLGGQPHFGWARFNVNVRRHVARVPLKLMPRVSATLTGFAYETDPGKSIVAGDEGSGTSLGHLALGSSRH